MNEIYGKIVLSIVLVFAASFTASAQKNTVKCSGANGLTEQEINGILNSHNRARAELKLPPLKWNCKLADLAQEWATRGKFEHRSPANYGENIFVASMTDVPINLGFDRWMSEKNFWHNASGTCQSGKFCTHYTQVVWKKTNSIGCGINRNAAGKWKVVMICNYDPMGNLPGPAF